MATDLRVSPGPGLPHGLVIPSGELEERFSRSPCPGGQSVNTTDSRVELLWDPAVSTALTSLGLTEAQLARLRPFRVVASEHRSQHRNRAAARERLADAIRAALAPPPPPRVPTKPSKASQRRRLDFKRRRSQTKTLRRRPPP